MRELDRAILDRWNEIGRDVATKDTLALTEFHEGRAEGIKYAEDSRGPEMAEAVLQRVIELNHAGRAVEARSQFDPAHGPFIHIMEKESLGLNACAILGREEYLVQQGVDSCWHIEDQEIRQIDGICGFAWSSNRKHFATAHSDGRITIGSSFNAADADTIPALPQSAFIPVDLPERYKARFNVDREIPFYASVSVSDDGLSLLICDDARGVVHLHRTEAGWIPRLLFPSILLGLKEEMDEAWDDGDSYSPFFAMLHAALSPDGRFAALGTQDSVHYVLDLNDTSNPTIHAELGPLMDYPHNAHFGPDGTLVAFNSCHLFNGATFVSQMSEIEGLQTEPYEEHDHQKIINEYLRVYASGFVPPSMTKQDSGAFLLAGAGTASCVTPSGELLWELNFGSTTGGVDVCPKTQRILIASYSGMLHLIDPLEAQNPMISSGYKVPQELRRWIFWKQLDHPLIW